MAGLLRATAPPQCSLGGQRWYRYRQSQRFTDCIAQACSVIAWPLLPVVFSTVRCLLGSALAWDFLGVTGLRNPFSSRWLIPTDKSHSP